MNWLVFILVTYVGLAMQSGLETLLAIPDAQTGVSPSWLLILAVFVGLSAPASVVPWAMLMLGILVDLSSPIAGGGVLVGPGALGYLVGAFAVLQLRGLVFRQSMFTLAVMVFVVGLLIQLVIVALLTGRGLSWLTAQPLAGWNAMDQLAHRFLMLIYSAIAAIPAGYVLFKLTPVWGFGAKRM